MSTNSNNAGGATRIGSKFRSSTEATEHFKRHERVKNYDIQTTRVQSVSWNCDGSRIAAGSADRTVCVGSVDAACRVKCNFVGAGHTEAVEMVSFHHTNPNMLASASSDKTIRVWDARNPKTHTKLNTKAPNLNVTWSPDGNHILFGDKEDTLVIVDGRNLTRVDSMVFKDELNEMAFDKTGEFLFVTMGSGKIGVYKTKPCLEEVRVLQAHSAQASCQSIAMSPDGERMAIGATDAILSLWNIDDLICERAISRLDYPPRSISFSHDSRLLALGSEDHVIDIAYTDDGSRIHELHVDAETYSVAWHPRYHILAYSSIANERDRDTTIHLFGFLQ